MLPADEAAYREYVADRRRTMVRTAYLLAGDWPVAEGLVRATLAKLYVVWTKVHRRDDADLYANRILFGRYFDNLRKPWRRPFAATNATRLDLIDRNKSREDTERSRIALRAALASMPPKQRAVLVLLFWEGHSAEQAADVLNCSVKSINSRAARAVRHFGNALRPLDPDAPGHCKEPQ